MSRRKGGFLEFISLLFLYGIASSIVNFQKANREFYAGRDERTIGTIVFLLNIIVMIITMGVCIYQMGTFGIIMGIISCLSIYCFGEIVTMLIVTKYSEKYWKLVWCIVFMVLCVFFIYIKCIKMLLVLFAFLGIEILVVHVILSIYTKGQPTDTGNDLTDENITQSNMMQVQENEAECEEQKEHPNPPSKPVRQDPYAYHGTEKYDEFYNLREDEYREKYGDDFEDAIDDAYEEKHIKK